MRLKLDSNFNRALTPPFRVVYRFLAWPGILFAINATVNQHALRAKEGSSGPWGNLSCVEYSLCRHSAHMVLCRLSIMALLASYVPFVTIGAQAAAATASS